MVNARLLLSTLTPQPLLDLGRTNRHDPSCKQVPVLSPRNPFRIPLPAIPEDQYCRRPALRAQHRPIGLPFLREFSPNHVVRLSGPARLGYRTAKPLELPHKPLRQVPKCRRRKPNRLMPRLHWLSPDRPARNPFRESRDILRRELRSGRHLKFSLLTNRLYQDAAVRLARHDRRPAAAAFEQAVTIQEGDAAVFQFLVVAAYAAPAQNRLHALIEKQAGGTLPCCQPREREQPKRNYRLAPLPN